MTDTCPCTEDSGSSESMLDPLCNCQRVDNDIIIHQETCLLYQAYQDPTILEGLQGDVCANCSCPADKCICKELEKEALDEWRNNPTIAGALPPVLESNHPLMKKFQENLKRFLEKENAIAEEEILNLKEELRLKKEAYNKDLESIYRSDHDTNQQRVLIEEYEQELAQKRKERQAAEQRAKLSAEKYKKAKEKLDQDIINEREATEELEALTSLCKQLQQWRDDTESDLTISHSMSNKMKAEKRALADEKRQLDMFIYGLSTEVWKLESKLELFKKQMEIKQNEMEKVNDKVTAYAVELEDLEQDKRRLVSLWNSVLVNIQQRDKVYDSVKDDYRALQENYRTLLSNLDITKKMAEEEMTKGKELAMTNDKLIYDINNATKLYDTEDAKRVALETQIMDLNECLEMTERDSELIKSENQTMSNILKSSEKTFDKQMDLKLKLENEILFNLQECFLNDKAVETMANSIKKMREKSRKQEMSLMAMENAHAKVMLDIEVFRNRQIHNKKILEETLAQVKAKEKEMDDLEEKFQQGTIDITKKQRDLELVKKKYDTLREIFDMKSPQERHVDDLEQQIKTLRERAEEMQQEWLRMQAHVVRLSSQHQKLVTDVNLINKQIQICEQKIMRIQADAENIERERARVDRTLRDLQGKLEVLERNRKDATERNQNAQRTNQAVTFEYTANLKDAEAEIFQLEEDIENFEKEKINLSQELDRVQREALIWQRKGILAVELKKNMAETKSAAGELGQMRAEIHRMTVRKEQLRKIAEKLSDDLAQCVTRREIVMDKSRATAALEKAHGPSQSTSQSQYRHKLRLAKADVARVTKDVAEIKSRIAAARSEQEKLESEINVTSKLNAKLEERVATMIRECTETEKQKQWLLERVVRSQRLGKELMTAVKKQSLKIKKPKEVIIREYAQSKKLNETLRTAVETIAREYPYLEDKMAVIANTLTVHIPEDVPQLSDEECLCILEDSPPDSQENFAILCAEKPLE